MLNKKKIIAIFNKNYFMEQLITLLEDEGLEIEKIKILTRIPISKKYHFKVDIIHLKI